MSVARSLGIPKLRSYSPQDASMQHVLRVDQRGTFGICTPWHLDEDYQVMVYVGASIRGVAW